MLIKTGTIAFFCIHKRYAGGRTEITLFSEMSHLAEATYYRCKHSDKIARNAGSHIVGRTGRLVFKEDSHT
jgi:hypothetical protein